MPLKNTADKSPETLTPITGLAYALPLLPMMMLVNSLNVVQGIYAKYYGLTLATLSAVMFFAGLFDAITDPAIGYWSDRHHARTGSRRAFVIAGMVLALPCAWMLFVPAGPVSVAWFIFWYMAFYLAMTLFMIPHLAWGGELSAHSAQRTQAYGFRTLGTYVGLALYYLIPLLPLFATRAITPESMRYSILTAGILILPCLVLFYKKVPTGRVVHASTPIQENPFRALQTVANNKPFLLYLVTAVFFGLGIGIFYGLLFIVTDTWLGLGEHYVFLFLFHLAVATLLIKPSVWLTNHLGKQTAWAMGIAFGIACLPVTLQLLQGGEHSLLWLYLLQFLLGSASALGNVASPSLLTDIIDYDTLKSGQERSGTFFAIQSFLGKVSSTTLGYPLGGAIVGYYGFDPANPMHTDSTLLGFQLAMGWLPALISVIALGLVFLIPINAHRRAIIRRRLNSRSRRAKPEKQAITNHQTPEVKPQAIYD